jgi:hypothetical protein
MWLLAARGEEVVDLETQKHKKEEAMYTSPLSPLKRKPGDVEVTRI